LRKNSGRHWQGGLVYQETSPGIETNDLGFQSEASQRGISTALEYNEREPGRTFRRWGLFPFTNHQWNFDGDLVYGSFGLIFSGSCRTSGTSSCEAITPRLPTTIGSPAEGRWPGSPNSGMCG
jgi:hypothetical protein